MKTAVCVVLLLLSLHLGEALKCNVCMGKGGNPCSPTQSKTCGRAAVCAAFIIKAPPLLRSIRTCMRRYICNAFLKKDPSGTCCNTDFCN